MKATPVLATPLLLLPLLWGGTAGFAQSSTNDLLARLREHVERYQQAAPSFVAREEYSQNVTYGRGMPERRILTSEIVMVRLPDTAGWISFRDVLKVDGRALQDRQQRLMELLQSATPTALAQARRLAEESARFNLGRITRTINVPDIALVFLRTEHASRIKFESPRNGSVAGSQVSVFRFQETSGPSILRSRDGGELLASGRIWVEPQSGAIIRTELTVRDRWSRGSCVVDFHWHEGLGIRVPSRMTEEYSAPGEVISGTATYSEYRKFSILTREKR